MCFIRSLNSLRLEPFGRFIAKIELSFKVIMSILRIKRKGNG